MVEFVEEVIAGLLSDQEVRTFEEVIVPVFDIFQGRVKDLDLCQPLLYSYLDVLLYFSHHKDIAKVQRQTFSECCGNVVHPLTTADDFKSSFFYVHRYSLNTSSPKTQLMVCSTRKAYWGQYSIYPAC